METGGLARYHWIMTDASPDQAFRFEHSRPDVNAPGGRRVDSYLVLVSSLDEAYGLLADLIEAPREAILVGKGEKALATAKQLDMQLGTVRKL